MLNPNPQCPDECRFYSDGPSFTTAMYFQPVYDKHGNNLNVDMNITSGEIACAVCKKSWRYSTRGGLTDFTENKQND